MRFPSRERPRRRWLGLLTERYVFVRSGDVSRGIVIGPWLQLAFLLLVPMLVAALAVLGYLQVTGPARLVAQDQHIDALEQALAASAAAREQDLARLRGMIEHLDGISEQQRETITSLTELQATLQRELAATQAELAAVAQERDAAKRLVQALRDGAQDQVALAASAVSEKTALDARLAALEAHLATAISERDLARRAEKGMRWRVERMEAKLAELRDGMTDETARLRDWIVSHVSAIEGVLSSSGVDVKRLIRRVDQLSRGQGGPFIPAAEPVAARKGSGAREEDLADELGRLRAVHRVLMAMPLAAPMTNYRLTSRFGVRSDPFTRKRARHEGLDFGGPADAKILATAAGRVVGAGREGAYGIMVEIDHGMGIRTRYAHLQKALVRVGDKVSLRQAIGIMGSTGRSTSRHLHYEVRIDGRPLDPAHFLEAGRNLRHVLKG